MHNKNFFMTMRILTVKTHTLITKKVSNNLRLVQLTTVTLQRQLHRQRQVMQEARLMSILIHISIQLCSTKNRICCLQVELVRTSCVFLIGNQEILLRWSLTSPAQSFVLISATTLTCSLLELKTPKCATSTSKIEYKDHSENNSYRFNFKNLIFVI